MDKQIENRKRDKNDKKIQRKIDKRYKNNKVRKVQNKNVHRLIKHRKI